jgi:hypothetical protein
MTAPRTVQSGWTECFPKEGVMVRTFALLLLTSSLLGLAGCQSCCRRPVATRQVVVPQPRTVAPVPCSPNAMPPTAFPQATVPPNTVLPRTVPVPEAVTPAPVTPAPSMSQVPNPMFPQGQGQAQAQWQPAQPYSPLPPVKQIESRGEEPRVQLTNPQPLRGELPPTTKLDPPEIKEGITRPVPEIKQETTPEPPVIKPEVTKVPEPPVVDADKVKVPEPPVINADKGKSPSLPSDIKDFYKGPGEVYVGRRPSIEGLDWLKKEGKFAAVLHLRSAGENDAADRKQVEDREMEFVSLEVSPKTLTPAKVQAFARFVTSNTYQPLFVYDDQDGALVGPLWYLYFRTVENLDDATAQRRARNLGLRDTGSQPQTDMWLAVQQYLKTNP